MNDFDPVAVDPRALAAAVAQLLDQLREHEAKADTIRATVMVLQRAIEQGERQPAPPRRGRPRRGAPSPLSAVAAVGDPS
jgi:multidrug resistance efflux pump